MQTVITQGGRLGLRVARGVVCQLSKGGPLHGLSGAARARAQQAGVRSGMQGAGRPLGSVAGEGRRALFIRTFSSGGGGSSGGAGGGGGSGGGGAGSGKGGFGGGLWAAYLALLDRKPLATKAVTAALLNGLGDVTAQAAFEKGNKFDWRRLGVFTLLGLVFIGPALHFWYGTLGRVVTAPGVKGTVTKLVADQLCFAPVFISSILTLLMTLEGQPHLVPDKLRQDLFPIVKSNWLLWVPFQFFNFRFVPGNLQVLASNICALGWNTYMSYATHKAH